MNSILYYDNSFEGLLTCVFEIFERKLSKVKIVKRSREEGFLFAETEHIDTCLKKSQRVWGGLLKKASPTDRARIYKSFLSELPGIEDHILGYIRLLFTHRTEQSNKVSGNFTNPHVLTLSKTTKMVGREKHRMDAFVRFKLTKDDIYFATIEPDFNVLPLNAKHFKNRYADQKWLIYDLKRRYGIYYDLKKVEAVTLELKNLDKGDSLEIFTIEELQYESLWKNYFNSTNIASRINMRLHLQHVPKRYWKYLSEKH